MGKRPILPGTGAPPTVPTPQIPPIQTTPLNPTIPAVPSNQVAPSISLNPVPSLTPNISIQSPPKTFTFTPKNQFVPPIITPSISTELHNERKDTKVPTFSTAGVKSQGYLELKLTTNWESRWFILGNKLPHILSYFDSDADVVELGEIDIKRCKFFSREGEGKGAFCLSSISTGKNYTLRAVNEEEKNKWSSALSPFISKDKDMIRVHISDGSVKSIPIDNQSTVKDVIMYMKKKMRNENSDGYGLYETKKNGNYEPLKPEDVIVELKKNWNGEERIVFRDPQQKEKKKKKKGFFSFGKKKEKTD